MEGEKKGRIFYPSDLSDLPDLSDLSDLSRPVRLVPTWTLDFRLYPAENIFQPCFSGKSVYSIGMTKI